MTLWLFNIMYDISSTIIMIIISMVRSFFEGVAVTTSPLVMAIDKKNPYW